MSKMKSIREIEMERAVAPNFGKGITVASGFDLGAKAPLDSRMTVKTIEERDAHVTGNRAYEGMLVYVEADKKTYQLINNTWEEFGFNEEKFEAGIKPVKDRLDTLEELVVGGEGEGIEAILGDVAQAKEDIVELQTNLTKEISDREAAITELDNKIQKGFDDLDEAVERAFGEMEQAYKDADAELKAELNAKISTNEGNIAKNTANIAKEVQDRTAAVNAVSAKVSELDAAYKNADTAINGRLDALEGNTADLEQIRTDIESNTSAINKEVADRQAAVKSVDDKLTAEVSRATAAEVALGKRIDSVVSNVERVEELVDTKAAETLQSAKSYTDGKVTEINANHNNLAERVTANEGQLGLVDSKIEAAATTAVNSSKSYTDGQVTTLKSTLEAADLQVLSDANAYTDQELTKLRTNLTEDITAVEESVEAVDGKVVALDRRVTSNEDAIDSLRNALSNKNSNTIVVETEDDIESHNPNPKKGDLAFVISTKRMYIYKENGGALAPTDIEGRLAPQGWVIFDTITSELDLVDYLKKSDAASTYRRLDTKIVEGDLHTDLSTKINNKADKSYVVEELAKKTNEAYVNAKVEEVVSPVRTLANQNKTDIANEVTARKAAITAVEASIATETTNRTQAINTVTSAINTEIADRKEAIEGVNSTISGVNTKLTQEISARETAVSGVDAKVTQEVADRKAAISGVETTIANEVKDIETAMSNETTRVNALIETLNSKIAQADALIATLQGKLTTLEEIETNRIVFDKE